MDLASIVEKVKEDAPKQLPKEQTAVLTFNECWELSPSQGRITIQGLQLLRDPRCGTTFKVAVAVDKFSQASKNGVKTGMRLRTINGLRLEGNVGSFSELLQMLHGMSPPIKLGLSSASPMDNETATQHSFSTAVSFNNRFILIV